MLLATIPAWPWIFSIVAIAIYFIVAICISLAHKHGHIDGDDKDDLLFFLRITLFLASFAFGLYLGDHL